MISFVMHDHQLVPILVVHSICIIKQRKFGFGACSASLPVGVDFEIKSKAENLKGVIKTYQEKVTIMISKS